MLKMNRLKILAAISMAIAAFSTTELHAAQVLFTPQLSIGEEYSDNIYLNDNNKQDDFITTIGLGLNGQILWRTAGLVLDYNPSYNRFADHSDLSYWRHAANLHAWKDFSREARLELTDNFLQTEDPTDNTAQYAPDNPLVGPGIPTDIYRRGRRKYRQNFAEARFTKQFGVRDTYFVALQNLVLRDINTAPNTRVSDYTVWQPMAGLDYWFTRFWGLETRFFYANRDYVDQVDREEYNGSLRLLRAFTRRLSGYVEYRQTALAYAETPPNDYMIYSPSAGITYEFEKDAHVSIGGGYYVQNVDNGSNNDNWIATSEIYKRWSFKSSYISLTGSSGYDIRDTGTEVLGLDIYYEGRIDMGYNFTRKLSGAVYGGYRYDKYPDQTPERIDHYATAGAGLDYQALRWMSLAVNYDYRKLTSGAPTQVEYAENRVLLLVTFSPTVPYRWQ